LNHDLGVTVCHRACLGTRCHKFDHFINGRLLCARGRQQFERGNDTLAVGAGGGHPLKRR
jgi:hypothetical protein